MNTATNTELAEVAKTQTTVDAMAVVTLSPEKYAAEVYQPFKAKLSAAIDSVRAIDYDIKTTAGMAVAIKARALFRDLRIDADKERKARKEPITKIGKLLESGYDGVEEMISPLEELFDADIKAEEKRKEDEKAAKIAAERARLERIADAIAAIREDESDAIRINKTAADTQATLTYSEARTITEELFQERFSEAVEIHAAVLVSIRAVLAERIAAEAAAAKAEAERIAELARIEAERAELAVLRAEQAERERVAADTKRQLEAQAAQIVADLKALEDERERQEFMSAASAIGPDIGALVESHIQSQPDAGPFGFKLTDLADTIDDQFPTDAELVSEIREAMNKRFGLSYAETDERMVTFDYAAALLEVA